MREICKMILGFAQGCAKDEYFFGIKQIIIPKNAKNVHFVNSK